MKDSKARASHPNNFWTWKKVATVNSPYSINKPEYYNLVTEYIRGGQHPGFELSQKIFDEYLNNMKTENCTYNKIVTRQLLREKGCYVPALAYDTMPGIGKSFSGLFKGENESRFRKDDKMNFVSKTGGEGKNERNKDNRGREDNPWNNYSLLLSAGEWAEYTVRNSNSDTIAVSASISPCACNTSVEVFVNEKSAGIVDISDGIGTYKQKLCEIDPADKTAVVRIKIASGCAILETIYFD